ncbi:RecQ family ATP-dependent DNA helicase [Microbacterium sp. HJ5]
MPDSSIAETAREVFGWQSLRDGQEEAVAALVDGRDVIAVLPTGAGKSAVYQLAGAMLPGITVVVSPLIALQADQLARFEDHPRAPRPVAVNSSMADGAVDDAWTALEHGEARYVYLAPEQLAKDDVRARLRALKVALLAIDEAHCVASWGHDFRPDYLRLGDVRSELGAPPTVALTATGADPVRREVAERLGLRDPLVVVRGVDRPNIDLTVHRSTSGDEKRVAVEEFVEGLPRPGLVYTATRRQAEECAAALQDRGLRAEAYHAGLAATERSRVHEDFLDDRLDVVVATSAFGMGIDKPNVRFVVHADVPESLDAYYQEIGRAGRDGRAAAATLFYRSEDLGLRRYFVSRSVDEERLAAAYAAIAASATPLPPRAIAEAAGVSARAATGLVNLLVEGAAVRVTRRGAVAVNGARPADAAAAAREAAERRARIEESRLAVMQRYAETRDCRRRVLLGYFGDDLGAACDACDTCRAGTADEVAADDDTGPFPAGSAVAHREWGRGRVVDVEDDRITVFFDEQGYKVLALEVLEQHRVLTRITS